MKTIKVTMVNGKPTIETAGFSGASCLDATRNLEALLSGDGEVEVRDTRFDENTNQEYETN